MQRKNKYVYDQNQSLVWPIWIREWKCMIFKLTGQTELWHCQSVTSFYKVKWVSFLVDWFFLFEFVWIWICSFPDLFIAFLFLILNGSCLNGLRVLHGWFSLIFFLFVKELIYFFFCKENMKINLKYLF